MNRFLRVEPRTFRRTLFVLATLATLIVAIQQYVRVAQKLQDPAGGTISDFDRWMVMTPRFLNDRVDYVNDELPTPPLTLMIFAPFTAMSRPAAHFAWVLVKLPLVCLIFSLVTRTVEQAGVRLTTPALLLIMSGWWLPAVVDAQEGQTNLLVLAPLVAGVALAQRGSPAHTTAAGALIGLGVAVKLTPIAFVAYFAWRRRFRLVAAAAASVALCWLILPALAFGWDQNLTWFQQWARIMIVPYVARGDVVYSTSQSVAGFALRMFSHALAFDSHHGGVTVSHFVNVADLDTAAIQRGVRLLMIATAALGVWWMRKPLESLRAQRYIVEIAAVAAFMLWFSERTWVHHYVSFVLVLSAAAMTVSDRAVSPARRRAVACAAVLFFAVLLVASEAGKSLGPDAIDWSKAYGSFLLASIALTIAVLRGAGPTLVAVPQNATRTPA